jgi:hypothetical protein
MKNILSDRVDLPPENNEDIEQPVELSEETPPKKNKGGRPRTVNGNIKSLPNTSLLSTSTRQRSSKLHESTQL